MSKLAKLKSVKICGNQWQTLSEAKAKKSLQSGKKAERSEGLTICVNRVICGQKSRKAFKKTQWPSMPSAAKIPGLAQILPSSAKLKYPFSDTIKWSSTGKSSIFPACTNFCVSDKSA